MGISYLDKAIIFLLPILVLTLFKENKVYVSIEYIYSIVVVILPFIGLGLNGYFFYNFRNSDSRREVVSRLVKTFYTVYLIFFFIGIGLVLFHYYIIPFEDYIAFIISRSLFLFAHVFLNVC